MKAVCINSGCKFWRGTVCDYQGYCSWRKDKREEADIRDILEDLEKFWSDEYDELVERLKGRKNEV